MTGRNVRTRIDLDLVGAPPEVTQADSVTSGFGVVSTSWYVHELGNTVPAGADTTTLE